MRRFAEGATQVGSEERDRLGGSPGVGAPRPKLLVARKDGDARGPGVDYLLDGDLDRRARLRLRCGRHVEEAIGELSTQPLSERAVARGDLLYVEREGGLLHRWAKKW
jgi:hypothetical protein